MVVSVAGEGQEGTTTLAYKIGLTAGLSSSRHHLSFQNRRTFGSFFFSLPRCPGALENSFFSIERDALVVDDACEHVLHDLVLVSPVLEEALEGTRWIIEATLNGAIHRIPACSRNADPIRVKVACRTE